VEVDEDDNIEEDYLDDDFENDFEQQAEGMQEKTAHVKPLKIIMEATGESKDQDMSTIQDNYGNDSVIENSFEGSTAHIEKFLKTATA
jgi:hypothetical protein